MSKAGRSKRSKPRKSERGREPAAREAAAPAEIPARIPAQIPAATPGQRLYDMPYGSPAPQLINAELGLDHLVARAGHNAGYDIDLTLLDAPDHRLMRSGVLLAHRVLDGRGEWYLGAPDWVPLLPEELIESMSQTDLPEEMADLIRPFQTASPAVPGGGPALRAARVRPTGHHGSGAGPAAGRQGDGATRRADHGPLPRGHADAGRTGAGSAAGGLARPVPDRRGRHGAHTVPEARPSARRPRDRTHRLPRAAVLRRRSPVQLVPLRARRAAAAGAAHCGSATARRETPAPRTWSCRGDRTASRAGRPPQRAGPGGTATCSTNWTGWSAIPVDTATSRASG